MNNDVVLEICMGSSCFARGNNVTARYLQKTIDERGWGKKVQVKGLLCQGDCKEGPIAVVNGREYRHIDAASLLDILEEILKELKNEST